MGLKTNRTPIFSHPKHNGNKEAETSSFILAFPYYLPLSLPSLPH
jgi:hypothetical protein